MAIPPFPSKDMAKLVLGYLMEEQLMTAYDEFLNESPYLDALRNEYDRVLMNSLRNILAEYRAVKIYVETCKPISLRRRLFQCSNLLEVVKFLVQHIDINKLQDLNRDRVSYDSEKVTTSRIGCDVCHSLKLDSCVCPNKKRNLTSSKTLYNSESIEAGRSLVQATSLSELPGNQVLLNSSIQNQQNQSRTINQQQIAPNGSLVPSATTIEQNSIIIPSLQLQSNSLITSTQKQNVGGNTSTLQCSQNIAEFNTVLNQVYNNSTVTGSQRGNGGAIFSGNAVNNKIPYARSFQDFTTGVRGAPSSNVNIPDSSTTEKTNVSSSEKEQQIPSTSVNTQQRRKCVFRVGNVKHDVTEICSEIIDVDSADTPQNAPINQKPEDQKVTILSNVRVGNDDRLTALPKNATSTPLLHMQTIYINDTPVYRPKPIEHQHTFTRDEIMAMPTIILVPASGPSRAHAATCAPPQTTSASSSNVATSTCHIAPTLPPLNVDVASSSSNMTGNLPTLDEANVKESFGKPGLVKTVEALKNASVPKESTVSGSSSTNTPHMLPPQRKSSSTPRRTSHVRVLDFTTPRRILNESINENATHDPDLDKPVEVMLSKSPNVTFPHDSEVVENIRHSDTTVETNTTEQNNTVLKTSEVNDSVKKKTIIRKKAMGWDADLRALVGSYIRTEETRTFSPKPKSKQKHEKKVTEEKGKDKNKTIVNSVEKTRKKSSAKNNSKNSKEKQDLNVVAVGKKPEEKVPSPTVSPTGILNPPNKVNTVELEKTENKSNDEERIDTPEVERLSLRNEIGAKLNISDILETPYKQALYEIQMETPRFLGPELPDDPMSDIKITDIPTPRFLTTNMPYTPKPAEPTPSYSSRLTDYSSGGSYYKPDDQDFLPTLDGATYPVTSTYLKDNSKKAGVESKSDTTVKENQSKDKSKRNRSRPVRQCTKNVSYYNSPMINKNTDINKKADASSCSDTVSANSSLDDIEKDNMTTPRIDRKKEIASKSGAKKNLSLCKKRSPLKRSAQKPFMKIKPRRSSPTKDSGRKNNKKSIESTHVSLKGKSRVKNCNKEKVSCTVPAPTKSRRKSSTPRKLHCTKTFNSESSGHESPEARSKERTYNETENTNVTSVQDSDTEQLPLRWSDDGSQDTRIQGETESLENDTDDISKIKEYIDKTVPAASTQKRNNQGSLQSDLVKRGFDRETAEKIERDLLSTPVHIDDQPNVQSNADETKINRVLERSVESDCSTLANNLVINEEDSDDVEFTVHACNEDSTNYHHVVQNEESKQPPEIKSAKLKEKFSMEVCIDEGIVVRLRATSLYNLFELDSQICGKIHEPNKETEMAVSSISNMERLYTPMKDPIRAQCYEIFDSTLTSIDTPLKADKSVRQPDTTVTEIVLENDVEEELEMKEKAENRKRKRLHCNSTSDESVNDSKKVKPEAQFMLQTKDIKDMDIEVLLTKLHGS